MALTRDFRITVKERAEKDPGFVQAILDEAASLFFADEPNTARLLLREVVNATCGFEKIAELAGIPGKSLHRMLSAKGNPGMDNLAAVFSALQKELRLTVNVQFVPVKQRRVAAKVVRSSAKLAARRR